MTTRDTRAHLQEIYGVEVAYLATATWAPGRDRTRTPCCIQPRSSRNCIRLHFIEQAFSKKTTTEHSWENLSLRTVCDASDKPGVGSEPLLAGEDRRRHLSPELGLRQP